jgi:hypothetical protein
MTFDPTTKYKIGSKLSVDGFQYVIWSVSPQGIYLKLETQNSIAGEISSAYWHNTLGYNKKNEPLKPLTTPSLQTPPNEQLTSWVNSILSKHKTESEPLYGTQE